MSASRHDLLIDRLTAELAPVRVLAPPVRRALGWLLVVAAVALLLACFANLPAMRARLTGAADMWLSMLGMILTTMLAAVAAFETSVPGRSPRWALLPLPAVVLWLGSSGLGCLRSWVVPGVHPNAGEEPQCMMFIVGLSVPLCVLLVVMLRRACPVRPGLTAAMAGLAAAAASATLLMFFHPLDASASDLAAHVIAVLAVILLNRMVGGRLLRSKA